MYVEDGLRRQSRFLPHRSVRACVCLNGKYDGTIRGSGLSEALHSRTQCNGCVCVR